MVLLAGADVDLIVEHVDRARSRRGGDSMASE
jgi:hypothetical protein